MSVVKRIKKISFKDQLFLLPNDFFDNGRHEYCPECAEMWGIINYFPIIRPSLEIIYVSIDKPRKKLVDMIGHENQNCPTLILNDKSPIYENCGLLSVNEYNFFNNVRDIGLYYSHRFKTSYPRGA
ncbi:DUF3088 family protein [Hellea sp.]|nr:DUF3088 family protein [Hellea sp.]